MAETDALGSWGMHVECVSNAFRALECLRIARCEGRPYDLAILDHQMPDMDGMELARAIKSDPALAAAPLVLLTSVSYRGGAEEALHAGFSAFLLKPIRQSQLYDCIATVMGMSSEQAPRRLITSHTLGETPSRARVLVAEDNAVNQRLAARRLEKRGCRVDVVATGLEAVEAVTRIAYDCVFMDCQMPEMDGYAATSMIRQREALTGAHIPIIAMTANAMEGDRERCLAAGMDDYISKPVEPHGGASQPVAVTRSGAVPTGITGNCGARLIDHYLFGAKLDTPWDPRL